MIDSIQPRIFVTGATGELGRIVISELLKRVPASRIVAGVRSANNEVTGKFAALGIEVRVADYARPDSLPTAFEGIDRLLLISSSTRDGRVAQHENVIAAAKESGVGLLAYTSLLHADTSPLGFADEHLQTEACLKASGVPFVLLRHGWYTENHMASVGPALQYGAVLGCAGEGRFSTATRADLAEAAAVVLTSLGHAGQVYELAGDVSYSLSDLAAAISAASGRPVVYRDMPKAAFKGALIGMHLPEEVAELVADADVAASMGALEDDSCQLSRLIGRPTTSWQKIVAQTVAAA